MSRRVEDIAARLDAVLSSEDRPEVLALLALLAGHLALAQERVRELQHGIQERTLSVEQATQLYPVSRSFIYEHGEEMGFARRVPGARKLLVDEANLRRVLGADRRG